NATESNRLARDFAASGCQVAARRNRSMWLNCRPACSTRSRPLAADVVTDGVKRKRMDDGQFKRQKMPIPKLEFHPVPFVIVCSFYAAAVIHHRHHSFPIDDEIAFVPATISDAWMGWLTKGFSEYFLSYGSWSASDARYIKPIDNLAYWFVHKVCAGLSFHG